MPFDFGFNFRFSSGYVTDASYCAPVLAETYPHTYSNSDGKSINAGWSGAVSPVDGASGNDPRIAGVNYANNTARDFTVDLSSGSAPGAGDYSIDCAIGFQLDGFTQSFAVLDNTTSLIDSGAVVTTTNHYYDATLANVAATTSWTGTPTTKTFATTTAILRICTTASLTTPAHFRLTLQGGGATNTDITPLAGALAVAGLAPGIINPVLITPPAGVLGLYGLAPRAGRGGDIDELWYHHYAV